MFNGRRQPSRGGTSRMTRECQVRICERLGVKFPGPTRHLQRIGNVRDVSAQPLTPAVLVHRGQRRGMPGETFAGIKKAEGCVPCSRILRLRKGSVSVEF